MDDLSRGQFTIKGAAKVTYMAPELALALAYRPKRVKNNKITRKKRQRERERMKLRMRTLEV